MKIKSYHAHLYYNQDNFKEAKELRQKISDLFHLEVGRLHENPVGPHPVWSCQVSVPVDRFAELIPWLSINRGTIDFFIHPITGNDLLDHSQYVMWLGKSYNLDVSRF